MELEQAVRRLFAPAATVRPGPPLSTLFPPVRPRGGYLEVRYLDAQPAHRIAEAVTVVAGLLYDRRARRAALDLLLPRVADQRRAWAEAAAGHSPQTAELLSIARTASPAAELPTAASPAAEAPAVARLMSIMEAVS